MLNEPEKWRGGYEDFTKEKAPLVIWDIPNGWLDSIFRRTERKEPLKDTLCWAMGADLIEGFPELDDDLFNQMIIPVRLADTGKRAALRVGGDRVLAWMSGLSEGGVQVKLFARSRVAGQFDLLSVKFRRPKGSYDKFNTEAEDWNYGVIEEWKESLPELILDLIAN